MSILHSQQSEALINRLVKDQSSQPRSNTNQFDGFIRSYYYGVPYDDLSQRDIFDLRGAALAHWELCAQRPGSEAKIRLYCPDVERDGWRSKNAVLELVCVDRPFLVDSVSMILNEFDCKIHLVVHPIFVVQRNSAGELQKIAAPLNADFLDGVFESFLHFEFERPLEESEFERIEKRLQQVLQTIEIAVEDWNPIRQRLKESARNLEKEKNRLQNGELEDYAEFCEWLRAGNFTLLGYCEFRAQKQGKLKLNEKSLLGILREYDDIGKVLPADALDSNGELQSLIVTKANSHSPIHRASYLDLILIPKFSAAGACLGTRAVVGLFSSSAYNGSASQIPVLRTKIKKVLQRSRFSETTHSIRVLINIIDNYPRDLLFRVDTNELFEDVAGTLELQERNRVRLFLRRERYGRFYSALVYIPHELFGRELRVKIESILMESLKGTSSEFFATFSGSVLARINYTIYVDKDSQPVASMEAIQQQVQDTATTWQDSLQQATIDRYGEDTGGQYLRVFGNAFNASFQEDYLPWVVAADLEKLTSLDETNDLSVSFFRPLHETDRKQVRLKLFSYGKQVSPSDSLPVLENMGLRVKEERPYEISLPGDHVIWLHDYSLIHSEEHEPDRQRRNFEDAFTNIWRGEAENDVFNRLVLMANLTWRQVCVLRAYSKYLKQIGHSFSDAYVTDTLIKHLDMTGDLVKYFETKFDPTHGGADQVLPKIRKALEASLDMVASLDEDVILRSYKNAMTSTIRTNYFCVNAQGKPKNYISFKIDCDQILKMPDPRPKFEIFVYSPRTEAVHLRGGKVARGGLRWSDRKEDFRTEVLGLVKAQMVKNAVIVPVGSKGGFVIKQSPPPGKTIQDEAIACYTTFIRGMLDITDNIVDSKIDHPANVKRYDEDDPYLVVAADKGTATFSDIANSVSEEYGFWLGDAFASGGSVGYDHKAMGITARGAWESVKRHFRELGTDVQTTDFTVIGIGDMGGDVFGNGMLLSEHIQLLGAFNHIEIFLDPNPDPKVSFEERKRLFTTPRISWKDYNPKLISEGGGVYDRTAKAIDISPEVRERFKIKKKKLTPNELMHAMLKAPVDLLWNGGIGTYVKASTESHADTENRSNDAIRVNGNEVGARVVGEGGNLGMTQLGRVEYCMHGGRCYTDSIDNSGGVDCSDHEVNIKILLNQVVNNGEMTVKQREKILRDMTDVVAELVLESNYQQSQALSSLRLHANDLLREHSQFIQTLEREGKLDRAIEFLPDWEEIERRESAGQGLEFPELSVLLAYSKMTLYDELLDSDMPEDAYLANDLDDYFPDRLSNKYRSEMYGHRLKREIIATYVTNNMINRVGPTFADRMRGLTSASFADIARAYCAAREIYDMRNTWASIEQLDNKVPAQSQLDMLKLAEGLLERATLWLLRHRSHPINIDETVKYFKEDVKGIASHLSDALSQEYMDQIQVHVDRLIEKKVPEELVKRVVECIPLSTALDIVEIIKSSEKPVTFVSRVYFDIGAKLELMWIRQQVANLPVDNHWHGLAKSRLSDDIHACQAAIANDVVQLVNTDSPQHAVEVWMKSNAVGCRNLANIITDMKSIKRIDFATLSVAISEVHLLGRGSD